MTVLPFLQAKAKRGKKKALASRVPTVVSPNPKKSNMGVSHRGVAKDKPSGSQAVPPSPIKIPPSPVADVATLIEDYASGDEGRPTMEASLARRRKIDFVDETGVPKVSRPLTDMQEEQDVIATEAPSSVPSSTPPSILSSTPPSVHNEVGFIESDLPINVQSQPEVSSDGEIVPP